MRDAKGRFVSDGPMTFCEKHGRQPNVSRFPKWMASCPVCNRQAESLAATREGLERYFSKIDAEYDDGVHWQDIGLAASILERLTNDFGVQLVHDEPLSFIRAAWRDQHAA